MKIKKSKVRLASLILASSVLSFGAVSCTSELAVMKLEKATKKIIKKVRGEKEVQTNETKYSIPLRLFGRDLAYVVGSKRIMSISYIENQTSDPTLYSTITGILNTAVTKLTSSPLAARNLEIYTLTEPQQVPGSINIMGAITESDQILNTTTTLNLDASFGGGSTRTDSSANLDRTNVAKVLSLDLHAQVSTGSLTTSLPLGYASNTMILYKKTEGGGFSLYIAGNGFTFGGSATVSDSANYAVRMLTEFSLLQLLGRIYTQPYWHCVRTKNQDRVMFQYMYEDWANTKYDQGPNDYYKDVKIGKYADIARIFYGYYLAEPARDGKLKYTVLERDKETGKLKKVKKTFGALPFLRKEYVEVEQVDQKGNKVRTKMEVLRVNKKNVENFIKILLKYYNIKYPMTDFRAFFQLLNETPFCGYPYDRKLRDYLLTELEDTVFERHPGDVVEPTILTSEKELEKLYRQNVRP